MATRRPITYADAGVRIDEADRATAEIKKLARATFGRGVLTGIGSFGGAYALSAHKLNDPVLISSADGVGTKLQIAFLTGVHDTVGQCLVNHCVNDIAVQGAAPLFFLDYFATGQLDAAVVRDVVAGLSRACRENGCALIGGETAEMPGMYHPGEYDLAGFIVGATERRALLTGSGVRSGNTLIGLPSTGLHTNGYSLARKLLFEVAGYGVETKLDSLGAKLGEELLKIHRSYLKPLQALRKAGLLRGAAHITGGGITDNTPRMLPNGLAAHIRLGSWPVLPIFELLRDIGQIEQGEMLRTFNMGLGLIAAVPSRSCAAALDLLRQLRETAYPIGRVEAAQGKQRVIYEN